MKPRSSALQPPLTPPDDPDPMNDGLRLLTGPDAADPLAAALAAAGGELLRWTPRQVDHQPGTGTTVAYRARVRWADGAETTETLGACHGDLPAATARLRDGDTEIGLWRFPHDPDLPGLPHATDPHRLGRLAADLGLGDGTPATIRLRAYRPRRRAVIQAQTTGGTVFVKVVRPTRAQPLHARHRAAHDCPAPRSLGWTDDGLVVLTALPGRTLRETLLAPGEPHLDPDAVITLLDRLPHIAEHRDTWGRKAPHYARVIAGIAPELGAWATDLATAVDHPSPEGPTVPVHGDFYEAQLMVESGLPTGLLDLDTTGQGERLDDAACLLGHLAVLAQLRPDRAPAITATGTRLQERLERDLCPSALRRRTAAVVLSLATGPHRVQEPRWRENTRARLRLAQQWVEWS
ncbi:hypothetical protein Actkin_03077 [Actinokineospora sp. UTMC 2448]|nr:hypothetical protein Actkin_03077 [Actinokineospora sp. UTMC 2448]